MTFTLQNVIRNFNTGYTEVNVTIGRVAFYANDNTSLIMFFLKPGFFKIHLFIVILSFSLNDLQAQINQERLNQKIEFSKTELSLKECLAELNEVSGIDIIYSDSKAFGRYIIVFPRQNMIVKDAFNQIKEQAPVEVVENTEYIIIKLKDLKRSYIFKGRIFDKETGEALIGVNIYSRKNLLGTTTDVNGSFSFQLSPDHYQFIVSYMGYVQKTISLYLFNDIDLEIMLEPSELEIEEVKIIASQNEYEKLKIGRTIEKIESKTINKLSTNDINDVLQGRINGVWVTKVSGAPGDHSKIRIRGISSIFGSTDPLYIVDGMIVPVINFKTLGISDLNTQDVNSVTVLKDASSTALYGFLGGNGVIDIKTKTGGGEKEYNFSAKRGFQYFNKRYDFLNSEEFIRNLQYSDSILKTEFFLKSDKFTDKYPVYRDTLGNTLGYDDFQDLLFRNGVINEYQLSAKGSFKSIDYYVSGNYYNHKGIIENTEYNKYNFTCNLSKSFFEKVILKLYYKGNYQENINNLDNYLGNKSILRGINYEPAYYSTPDSFLGQPDRLFINNKAYKSIETLSNFKYSSESLFYDELRQKNQTSHSFIINSNIQISKSFRFKTVHSLSLKEFYFQSNDPSIEKYIYSKENYIVVNQQYDLEFEKSMGFHKLNAFMRYRNYQDNVYWNVDSTNIEPDAFTLENDLYLRGSQSIFGKSGSVRRAINSTIASCVSYNYKEKYFLSFLLNYDNLKEGYYVDSKAFFPSIAINWNLLKEEILHIPEWISNLNIYVNWGKSGNYPLNSLSNDLFITSTYYTNGTQSQAVLISNLANHNLRHEEVIETNIGANISLFKNKLSFSGDYYKKYNCDLLVHRQIPYYYGGGDIFDNIGEMENKGIELGLEIVPINRPGFFFSSRLGYSSNHQVIKKLHKENELSFNNADLLYPDFYARENESLGSITGYKVMGLWNDLIHSQKESERYPEYINIMGMAFAKTDTLTPHKLVENDKVIIGNSIPDFTLNWLSIFDYKNFSCEMLWYGVFGVDKYNATRASTYITGVNSDIPGIIADSSGFVLSEPFYESSYFIENANFMRLKRISITYNQPNLIASRFEMSYTLSFENIITLTKYSGYDPEASVYTNNNFSDNAIDRGAYPTPKGIFATINIKF